MGINGAIPSFMATGPLERFRASCRRRQFYGKREQQGLLPDPSHVSGKRLISGEAART